MQVSLIKTSRLAQILRQCYRCCRYEVQAPGGSAMFLRICVAKTYISRGDGSATRAVESQARAQYQNLIWAPRKVTKKIIRQNDKDNLPEEALCCIEID